MDQILEGEGCGRDGLVLPREHEGDGDCGREVGEGEGGVGGDDTFGDDAEANAGFNVGKHGADEAGSPNQNGGESGVAATGKHGVVDAYSFPAREHN